MENTTIKSTEPKKEVKGELTYEDKVIQKIIGIALENVDGL
ncbi:MAG: Asp23/Gls24 family envelope stress response protein, partial [Enterococcus sp.]